MMAQEMNSPTLEVAGLSYDFGKGPVLKDVGFRVEKGSFAVLLGPNGAGKTTLISLITRLYDSPTGQIRVAGHDVKRHSGRALARIGVVFQQSTLDLDLTVRQNLYYHAALHGLGRREAGERIEQELGRFEMLERAGEKVRGLNGGHRRRVEIARALLHRPDFLLLDEPTVGLDVASRRAIVAHAHRLARESGIAVLWATHLIDEIVDGDDVIVLHKGEIVAQGSVDEVNRATGAATIADSFDRLTGGTRV
jgi:ABC-2 type transport system ATP-binding protein